MDSCLIFLCFPRACLALPKMFSFKLSPLAFPRIGRKLSQTDTSLWRSFLGEMQEEKAFLLFLAVRSLENLQVIRQLT